MRSAGGRYRRAVWLKFRFPDQPREQWMIFDDMAVAANVNAVSELKAICS